MKRSPTLEGFRVIFKRPAFGLAEMAWRWSFGLAATALLMFTFFQYLDSLPVSNADLFLLWTRQPALILRALSDIFHGSAARLTVATIVVGLALAAAWVVVASLGRAMVLSSLLEHLQTAPGFRDEEETASTYRKALSWRPLLGLNALRATFALAVLVGCVSAFMLGDAASPDKDPSPGTAMLVFLSVLMFVGLAWAGVNWFLSLAQVFVVTRGTDTFGAISAAADLCRDRMGAVLAASTWFGLAHGLAFFVATSVVALPMAFLGLLPGGVVLGGILLFTLLYFAVADYLYMGRLAAYVWIAEGPEPVEEEFVPRYIPPPFLPPVPEPSARVDQEEAILSDVTV